MPRALVDTKVLFEAAYQQDSAHEEGLTNSLSTDALAAGKALFRQHEPLSFVDACTIAYMQTEGLGYLYAFDDDFDVVEDIYRLDTATDPCDPN